MKDTGHVHRMLVITGKRDLGNSSPNDEGDCIGKRVIVVTKCLSELTVCVKCSQAPLHFNLCFWRWRCKWASRRRWAFRGAPEVLQDLCGHWGKKVNEEVNFSMPEM
jgi:hypothetical protein